MNFETWLTFFAASCLIAISPGSGAILAMNHGLSYGTRKTAASIAGLQAGLLLVLLVAGAGIGSLLLASANLFLVVKIVGALYLIYLGYSQWRKAARIRNEADLQQLHRERGEMAWQKRWMTGFLTNATNPKGIVFMVAVLPQFIDPHRSQWVQLAILALTTLVIDSCVMSGYAYAASKLQVLFKNPAAMRWQNRTFGGVLMAAGTGLFWFKRHA